VAGQRQLDEDAVDGRIGVEADDKRLDLGLGRVGGQAVVEGDHAGLARRLHLGGDVDVAGGIVADEHGGQPRRSPVPHHQIRRGSCDVGAQLGCDRLAVDDAGAQPRAWISGG
jgi:hypothetical protein